MENTNVENRQLKQYIRDNLKIIAFNKDWTSFHLENNYKKLMRFCDYENYGELDIGVHCCQAYLIFLPCIYLRLVTTE